MSIDATRFDQHTSRELLQIEHSFYLGFNSDPYFRQLLSWQLDNEGMSSAGVKYSTRGRRMSGDMNTALGNCVLMILMVGTAMRTLGIREWDLLDDGDDCLVFIEREDLERLQRELPKLFLTYGMVLKVESIAHHIHEIEWCQSGLIEVKQNVYKFVRSPAKVLSGALGGRKYFGGLKIRRALLASVGWGELALNLGVPILQAFAEMVIRSSGEVCLHKWTASDGLYWRVGRELKDLGIRDVKSVRAGPIEPCARIAFAKTFGVSVAAQLRVEEQFRGTTLNLTGDGPIIAREWVGIRGNAYHTPETIPIGYETK